VSGPLIRHADFPSACSTTGWLIDISKKCAVKIISTVRKKSFVMSCQDWCFTREEPCCCHLNGLNVFIDRTTPTPTITMCANCSQCWTIIKATITSTGINRPIATPIASSISLADPTFRRPVPFPPGPCVLTGTTSHYRVFEYFLPEQSVVTADTCSSVGPLDTVVFIYQLPGGARSCPFVPAGCTNALTGDDDSCGGTSLFSRTNPIDVGSGYFYVVVANFNEGQFGPFVLTVAAATGQPPVLGGLDVTTPANCSMEMTITSTATAFAIIEPGTACVTAAIADLLPDFTITKVALDFSRTSSHHHNRFCCKDVVSLSVGDSRLHICGQ